MHPSRVARRLTAHRIPSSTLRGLSFAALAVFAAAMFALASPITVHSQETTDPAPDPTTTNEEQDAWTGELPPANSIALLTTSVEGDADTLVQSLNTGGCNVSSIAITEGGGWLVYVPGAPNIVNANFPANIEAQRPFFVRCGEAMTPDPVPPTGDPLQAIELGIADLGTTVDVQTQQEIHITLPTDTATGNAWRVSGALPAGQLAAIGDPEVTPGEAGQAGTTTLRFTALGAGNIPLNLSFDAGEGTTATQTWNANLNITQAEDPDPGTQQ